MEISKEAALILLEKGILAVILVFIGFALKWILQTYKLKGDTISALSKDRGEAYQKLWKDLAAMRPGENEKLSESDVKDLKSLLIEWYHHDAGAMYMSWSTAKQYMLLRRTLDERPIDDKKIRSSVSRLRTKLKVDCGIYSKLDAMLPLPNIKA